MAIARVNIGSLATVASGNLTVTLPAFTAGDLMFLQFYKRGSTGTLAVPSPDWTLLTGTTFTTGGSVAAGGVAYRVMQGGDASTVVITDDGASGKYSVGVSYSGQHATPIDVAGTFTVGGAGVATVTGAGVNIVTAGAALLFFKFNADDAAAFTETSGMAEVYDLTSTTGQDGSLGLDEQFGLSTGATGDKTCTAASATLRTTGILVAIRPAATGTSVPVFMNQYRSRWS